MEGERERERERERKTESVGERQRERGGEKDREREREAEREIDRERESDSEIFNIYVPIYAYATFLILFFHMADVLSLFVSQYHNSFNFLWRLIQVYLYFYHIIAM